MADPKNVFEAIHAVMEEVNTVPETGKVAFDKTSYAYASDRDLIRALRPAMLKHGLIMFPSNIEPLVTERRGGNNYVSVIATFTVHHVASDTGVHVKVMGSGVDPTDKAEYKAATGAQKYALRQVFTIEAGGDDPDRQASAELAQPERKSSKPRQSEPKKEKPAELDPEAMKKALAYTVPDNIPMAGQTLEQAVQDSEIGVMIINWLAGNSENASGEKFEPETEEDKKLVSAARYIVDFNPDFKENFATFMENNPEVK